MCLLITEIILSEQKDHEAINPILKSLKISIESHKSLRLAIVGHHDCAGNPELKAVQVKQIERSIKFLQKKYPDVELMGLWVDENWAVHELDRL